MTTLDPPDRARQIVANRARLLADTFRPPVGLAGPLDERLRPALCGRCGYDLSGLPPAGLCPECGRPFGGQEVLLYGYAAAGGTGSWAGRPPTRRQLAWRWAWSLPVLGLFAGSWHHWRFLGSMYGYLLSVPIGLAVATWRGLRPDPPADTVQVRLTPAGARVLNRGLGPVPYEKVDTADLIPWRRIATARVRPEPDGLVRVTLESPARFWSLRHPSVDAVVRCDPAAVDALVDRIELWRAAARVTAAWPA